MTETTEIKTNADGSINTAFYMVRGRHMRSVAAHEMAGTVKTGLLGRLGNAVRTAIALRHANGRGPAH